ncbi:MAG TPA: AraC family transcriptional regulator [Paenibacillus sp.]|uniref:helix-turn-helix transcriptional regulator n=1 Tax=Paenibacillus sp. TaxID=58172 RepID=UPI002BC7B78D|nr:AraC family transcriptional regulator [Paenibacillus sp.]HUC92214.1 AraC family transcriptional regulator [Paenibacillus sp.]
MSNMTPSGGRYRHVHWLPAIDWNVKFFGAHEQRVSHNWSVPKESHIGFEIVLVLEGCQETVMEENRYLLRPGDMMLILPGFKHVNRCVSKEGMRYFCAHFNVDDPAFRQEMMKHDRVVFPAGSEENGRLRGVLDQWIAMLRRRGGYSTADRFRMQAHLFELFGLLAQMVSSKEEESGKTLAPTSVQYAKAIAEAMKANFNPHLPDEEHSRETAFRIENIASSLGISPGYCQEVFRKVYGISPRRYLSELKLHEAKVMIRQPELTLKEIASRLGYSQLSHFSRQFKRWTGMSPLQFRQSAKQEAPR